MLHLCFVNFSLTSKRDGFCFMLFILQSNSPNSLIYFSFDSSKKCFIRALCLGQESIQALHYDRETCCELSYNWEMKIKMQ